MLYFRQCWECLAEAYLARGSHTSALRTFARVVEVRMCLSVHVYSAFLLVMYKLFSFTVGS